VLVVDVLIVLGEKPLAPSYHGAYCYQHVTNLDSVHYLHTCTQPFKADQRNKCGRNGSYSFFCIFALKSGEVQRVFMYSRLVRDNQSPYQLKPHT
jgi:hypothetical protein